MSSPNAVESLAHVEPKTEDSGDYNDLQDIDMEKQVLEDTVSQEDEGTAEATSQPDEEMEDLFGDDKEVDEVKHEGCGNL